MSTFATETVNTQFINQAFVDKVYSGHIKEAMDAMSTFVRQKLREEGFARKVFTPQLVTSSDLDRDLHDQPRIIVEKEPDSVAASFGLSAASEIRYFKTPRYEVSFYKIASPTFKKSKYELATYKANIQQILQENSVKDVQKQEDVGLVRGLKAITAAAGAGQYDSFYRYDAVAGTGGSSQANQAMGVASLMEQIAVMANNQQKPGKILMPYGLYLKLISRKATQVGSQVAGESFRGAGMNDFYGFQIITTNKSDILADYALIDSGAAVVVSTLVATITVPSGHGITAGATVLLANVAGNAMTNGEYTVVTAGATSITVATAAADDAAGTVDVSLSRAGNTVYVFAPESYLGQFYSLQEPTVFLKTEADMIEFMTYEAVGVGIGNVRGFVQGVYDTTSTAVDPDREYIVGP